MIKKILYAHYQCSERDGSYVHTREFAAAFRVICSDKGIEFGVLSPPLIPLAKVQSRNTGFLSRLRKRLVYFYLRDIKVLLVQLWRVFGYWKYLSQEKPDVVLMRFEGEALALLWVCRWLGIPSVIEVNSPDRDEFPSHYRHVPGLKDWFSNCHALKLANGAFAVSEELALPMRDGCDGKPVTTIPNGVDIEHFNPDLSGAAIRQRFGIAEEAVVYGFVGSFAPWHGLDLLVEAFARLLKEHHAIHLLLVGQANDQWQELLDRISAPDLAPHITVTGFVPPRDIPAYLAAMDIATLPNTAYYCSPLKLFEYMAMAKPTVGVRTGPVAATLEDGKEGLLFAQGSVNELAAELARLTRDKELRSTMGSAARQRIERDYTWQHNAEQVFDLLEKVYQRSQREHAA